MANCHAGLTNCAIPIFEPLLVSLMHLPHTMLIVSASAAAHTSETGSAPTGTGASGTTMRGKLFRPPSRTNVSSSIRVNHDGTGPRGNLILNAGPKRITPKPSSET